MDRPTLEQLESFIRQQLGIPDSTPIHAETRIEADLGCAGDDADELLESVADRFKISFFESEAHFRQVFGLGPNEVLFHSEDEICNWLFLRIARLFGLKPSHVFVDLKVGHLLKVLHRAPREK